ncbi:MAG: alpha/beta hydrolase [Candidatus Izemoplasmataceae bacterium]
MNISKITINQHVGVTLTCYVQDVSQEMSNMSKRPAMLIFPGGGYQFCSDREAEPIALSYLAKGYNAFVLRYSVKEHAVFPRPLIDAEDALSYLKDNAHALHINPDKIAVIGFSAGGHLATTLATEGKVRPNAVVLGYPALVRHEKYWNFPTPKVDQQTPEMFVFHTFEDDLVPLSHPLYIVEELSKANIPVEFHLFKSGVHGLSLGNKIVSNGIDKMIEDDVQIWFDLSCRWLDKVLDL